MPVHVVWFYDLSQYEQSIMAIFSTRTLADEYRAKRPMRYREYFDIEEYQVLSALPEGDLLS